MVFKLIQNFRIAFWLNGFGVIGSMKKLGVFVCYHFGNHQDDIIINVDIKIKKVLMSEMVHYTGKLIKIHMKESLENMCKQILKKDGKEKSKFVDSWQEAFENEYHYKEYVIINNNIFKVEISENDLINEDIYKASKSENGDIEFEVKYYNGGCSFDEALKEAMKEI